LPHQGLPKAWERIARRAKLKGVTLHTLRHSFATTANTLGCSEPTSGNAWPFARDGDQPLRARRRRCAFPIAGRIGRSTRSDTTPSTPRDRADAPLTDYPRCLAHCRVPDVYRGHPLTCPVLSRDVRQHRAHA
jgi:hypothetical protein